MPGTGSCINLWVSFIILLGRLAISQFKFQVTPSLIHTTLSWATFSRYLLATLALLMK